MSQTIRKGDLELILSGAAALQARGLSGRAIKNLKGIEGSDDLPVEAVYELAEDVLRIPREYVDTYLQTHFPSREKQLETISHLGMRPTVKALIEIYGKELIGCLRNISPIGEFEYSHSYIEENFSGGDGRFFQVHRTEKNVQKGLFKRKNLIVREVKREELAHLSINYNSCYGDYNLRMNIQSPFFSEASKEKLVEIKGIISRWSNYDVSYNYPI